MGVRQMPYQKGNGKPQYAGMGIGGSGSGGGSTYVLPKASADTLGGIKVGARLSINSDGVLSASDQSYSLPTASAETLGGVKVGTGLSITDGVLSATGGTGFTNNAGAHNSVYRGQSLGTSVSAEQYAQIEAGTFEGMFIGDYWTIGGVVYRIAAFDYWLHCGDTECTDHHVVLVPDSNFTAQKMNDTDITDGGYAGSKMHTTYLADAKSAIETAFGSSHILAHREVLTNTVASGVATSWEWYDSTVDLMNETMVYGAEVGSQLKAGEINYNVGIDKSQLPLFAHDPSRITNRAYWWLRSVVSATYYALVSAYGYADSNYASAAFGVRPAFAIYQATI